MFSLIKKLSFVLISISMTSAHSKTTCSELREVLNSSQADPLCEAINLKEDFSGKLLTDDMLAKAGVNFNDEFKVIIRAEMDEVDDGTPYTVDLIKNVGDSKSCKHPVAILGERHLKFEKAAKVGASVVEQFRFRGHEGFQQGKVKNLDAKSGEAIKVFGKAMSELVSKQVLFGSTIHEDHQLGIVVVDGDILDFKNKRSFFSSSGEWSSTYGGLAEFLASGGYPSNLHLDSSEACHSPNALLSSGSKEIIKSPTKFAAAFKNLLIHDTKANFSFHLEEGELDAQGADCANSDSTSCENFILKTRNQNIAKNISEIIPNLPCNEPFLVIVGIHHSPGLIELLTQQTTNANSR